MNTSTVIAANYVEAVERAAASAALWLPLSPIERDGTANREAAPNIARRNSESFMERVERACRYVCRGDARELLPDCKQRVIERTLRKLNGTPASEGPRAAARRAISWKLDDAGNVEGWELPANRERYIARRDDPRAAFPALVNEAKDYLAGEQRRRDREAPMTEQREQELAEAHTETLSEQVAQKVRERREMAEANAVRNRAAASEVADDLAHLLSRAPDGLTDGARYGNAWTVAYVAARGGADYGRAEQLAAELEVSTDMLKQRLSRTRKIARERYSVYSDGSQAPSGARRMLDGFLDLLPEQAELPLDLDRARFIAHKNSANSIKLPNPDRNPAPADVTTRWRAWPTAPRKRLTPEQQAAAMTRLAAAWRAAL